MEAKTAQIRIRKRAIIAEGAGGTVVFVTPSRARLLIDGGAADLVNAGPSQTKPAGPSEKKFSAAAPAGPSTDSASSSEPGAVAQLFASVVDRVSRGRKSRRQSKPESKVDAE